ncbi:PH domain-containing protein [Methanopyrus sp.]
MRLPTPPDGVTRIVTASVLSFSCAATAFMTLWNVPVGLTMAVLLAASLTVAWLLAPRYVTVRGRRVTIVSPGRRVTLTVKGTGGTVDLRGIRLLGVGGVFGYVGLYRVKGVGRCHVYSRRRSRLAVLETDRGTVLVGAEPPEKLLDALTPRRPGREVGPRPHDASTLR